MELPEIDSKITFLSRHDLYKVEKPYCTDFPVDSTDARMTNHQFDVRSVKIHDARKMQQALTLDRNGFCFVGAETSLRAEDATSERTAIMEAYTQEIASVVQANFPEYSEVRVMDFQVTICYNILHYHHLLTAIVSRSVDETLPSLAPRPKTWPSLPSLRQWRTRTFHKEELSYACTTYLQRKTG